MKLKDILQQVCLAYDIKLLSFQLLAGGHIHQTYKVESDRGSFLIQSFNEDVFPNPELIHSNFALTQSHINDTYSTSLLPDWKYTTDGEPYFRMNDSLWRSSQFIENSVCYEQCPNQEIAYQAGKILGKFHRLTHDMSLDDIKPIIPNFHNMEFRWSQLQQAIKGDQALRVKDHSEIIEKITSFYEQCDFLSGQEGVVPMRLLHNDPKLSNMLFDNTGRATHLIDLDTIMAGYIQYDVGDLVRSCCSLTAEDEVNGEENYFNINWFTRIIQGYAEEVNGIVVPEEVSSLATAGKYMTFIMAIRFLADYFNGDLYYHTEYHGQNLNRVKNQIKLFEEMYIQLDQLREIVYLKFS